MDLNVPFGKKVGFLKEGESSLEHIADRICPPVADVEKKEKRDEWLQKFKWVISEGYLIPAGRILRNITPTHITNIKNCVEGNTRILFSDGTTESIKTIVNKKIQKSVLSYNENTKQIESQPIVQWHREVVKDENWVKIITAKTVFFRNKTKRGLIITSDHKVYTTRGIIQAKDLKIGDYILSNELKWSRELLDVVIGCVLGDGCIVKGLKRKTSYLLTNSIHRKYLEWKQSILGGKIKDVKYNKGSFPTKNNQYRLEVPSSKQLTELFNIVYRDNKKRICPVSLLNNMGARGLAIWYMDDGSLGPVDTPTISLHCFDNKTEIENWFYNMFGEGVKLYKNNSIAFAKSAKEKFFQYIAPFIHEDFNYKLPCKFHTQFIDSISTLYNGLLGDKIIDIMYINRKIGFGRESSKWGKGVVKNKDFSISNVRYCIGVKQNHNFFTNYGLVANCFIAFVEDSIQSIAKLNHDITLISAYGGGFGVNFSLLRPEGDELKTKGGLSTGPVSFMRMVDGIGGEMRAGGSRKSAGLVCLEVSHPDIYKFIEAKLGHHTLQNLNISVGITNEFITAVRNDSNWDLKFNGKIYRTIKAKDLWEYLVECSLKSAEPGWINLSNINYWNPGSYYERNVLSNPCLIGSTLLLDGDKLLPIKENTASYYETYKTKIAKTIILKCNNGLEIECTPDHKIMLIDGSFIEANQTLNQEIMWGLGGREKTKEVESEVVRGFLFGDGCNSGGKLGVAVKLNPDKEREVYDLLLNYGFHVQNDNSLYLNKEKLQLHIGNMSFLNYKLPVRILPDDVLFGDSNKTASFLKGLFSANGSVNKYSQISLKTTCKETIKKIQILLASFGIKSWVVTNKKTVIKWRNGNYESKESYNLQIAPREAIKFKNKIGFIHSCKNEKIKIFNKFYHGRLIVSEILYNNVEKEVYDFKMLEGEHWNFANGFVAHNCQEINGEPFTSCALSNINFHKLVENGKFNYDKFNEVVTIGHRFLDNIVTLGEFPLQENKSVAERGRRIGLGCIGHAHALVEMKIRYGSEEHLEFIDKVYSLYRDSAYLASIATAEEKGYFPAYTPAYLDTPWAKRLPRLIRNKIKLHGLRNVAMLACPPTGDTGIFTNLSTGIEPMVSIKYKRAGKHSFTDPMYEKYGDVPEYKPYFVGMYEVTPREHLEVQSKIQQYIDNSISKTINIKKGNEQEFRDVILSEIQNIKGTTVYVQGSRKEHIEVESIGECTGGVCNLDEPITTGEH